MQPEFVIKDLSSLSESYLYNKYSNHNNFFYLDSSDPNSRWSQFSFMGFDPMFTIETKNGLTSINKNDGTIVITENPFKIIEKELQRFSTDFDLEFTPFWGGAVGYISYESAKYITKIIPPETIKNYKSSTHIPEIIFGFYNNVIVINKSTNQKWYIKTHFPDSPAKLAIKKEKPAPVKQGKLNFTEPESNLSKETYINIIKKIKNYIKEGDIYQANISHRFYSEFTGPPSLLYQKLKEISPAPFSAFLNFNPLFIYSSSPERFIQINKNNIQTRPIKGTIARSRDKLTDNKNKEHLLKSKKDIAELTMIIDLERNDLGRICSFGSVNVPQQIVLEEYAQVFHLTSTVEGRLRTGLSHMDAFKNMFPGGSITGAPKIKAMQIISEVESVPRSIYTGCIGYFGFNNNTDFNIAIRTMYSYNNNLYFHAGGGIIADSIPENEWNETMVKAKGMLDLVKNSDIQI
ncbi:MAG: aminodeoxychorismate synthase component I [bacterium]|nr:aminodeoxychorismate synthase component I [bacterium]